MRDPIVACLRACALACFRLVACLRVLCVCVGNAIVALLVSLAFRFTEFVEYQCASVFRMHRLNVVRVYYCALACECTSVSVSVCVCVCLCVCVCVFQLACLMK